MKVLHSHDAVIRILNEHLDLSDWPVQDVASLPCCDYPSRRHMGQPHWSRSLSHYLPER